MIGKIVNFFRSQPRQLILIRRISTRLRMSEWRQSPDLVRSAQKFLTDPEFLTMLDVLRNEAPANWALDSKCSFEERAIFQARNEGYEIAINNLEALGNFHRPKEEIEPTFPQDD